MPKDEQAPAEIADQEYLAGILRRVEAGDPSVTDEVFWLQAHTDFVTGNSLKERARRPKDRSPS